MNKTALITGASDGIGLALAKKLLDEDYHIIGTARSGKIEKLSHENLAVVQLDVCDEASINSAQQTIRKNYKKIDILINNAGIGPDMNSVLPDKKSFQQTFDTNVTGLVFFAEGIIDLVETGGCIYNISSKMGSLNKCVSSDSPAYRISKAALNMYTRVLAARLQNKNIQVISIHPGWVKTKLSSSRAPLTPEMSANGIFAIMKGDKKTATFWDAETQEELPW